MTSLHHIAQTLDSTAVRKISTEPTGAAKIFQFHCKTNILHSVFTLKSRIQVNEIALRRVENLLGFIGSSQPRIVLYLDNRPEWQQSKVAVPELIALNGNHWRKILTIFAKLCSSDDWRVYRDQHLLQHQEQICFTEQVNTVANVHIFSGKRCWQRFADIYQSDTEPLLATAGQSLFYRQDKTLGLCIFSPYFDYRQYPNVLIAETKLLMEALSNID